MAEDISNEVYEQSILDIQRSRSSLSDTCGPNHKFVVSKLELEGAENSSDKGNAFKIIITAGKTVREPDEPKHSCLICHHSDNVRDYAERAAYICHQSATRCTYTSCDAVLAINAAQKSMVKALSFSHTTKSHKVAKVYSALANIYDENIKEATRKQKQLKDANESAKSALKVARAAVNRLSDSDPVCKIEACRTAGDDAIKASNLACKTELAALLIFQKCWEYLDPELIEEIPRTNERQKQVITSCIKTASLIVGGFVVCVVLCNLAVRKIPIPLVSLSSCYLPYYLPYQAFARHRNKRKKAEDKKLKDAEEKKESENTILGNIFHQFILTGNFRLHHVTPPSSESDVEDRTQESDTDF